MKMYNLSEIMKNAWTMYRRYNAGLGTRRDGSKIIHWTFSDCLKSSWNRAKEAVKAAAEAARTGLRRMHYSEYKNNYSDCQTVEGSYDKASKTIEVLTLVRKSFKRISYGKVNNGLCPRCHTYCYGDCCAR